MPIFTYGDGYLGANALRAGQAGDAVLRVYGETATVDDFVVGSFGPDGYFGLGIVRLRDTDISVSSATQGDSNSLNIGFSDSSRDFAGTGFLFIEQGSSVVSTNNPILAENYGAGAGNGEIFASGTYSGLNLGRDGGDGMVVIDGVDGASSLTIQGDGSRANVGRDNGIGEIRVQEDGSFNARSGDFGRVSDPNAVGAIGRLLISGQNADVEISNAFGNSSYSVGAYTGSGSYMTFGRGLNGFGDLQMIGAGSLLIENLNGQRSSDGGATLRFAREEGSVGTGRFTGSGVEVNIVNRNGKNDGYAGAELLVGREGEGRVTVEQGATINVTGGGAFLAVGLRAANGQSQTFSSQLDILSGGTINLDGSRGAADFEGG
ncbi:MAG: hypothetical protein AAF568_05430, partial [Pseudomonadota bacterium]